MIAIGITHRVYDGNSTDPDGWDMWNVSDDGRHFDDEEFDSESDAMREAEGRAWRYRKELGLFSLISLKGTETGFRSDD